MNLAESLLEDLRSDDPSVRFAVLNRLEGTALSGAALSTFRRLAEQETDPGTRFHMDLILQAADHTPSENIPSMAGTPSKSLPSVAGTTRAAPPNSFQEIERMLQESKPDFFSLVIHLRQLSPGEGALVIDLLRHHGLDGFPEEVLPFVLRLFRQYGATQDIPVIEELCRHSNPRVLSAAIEALEKINPEDVKAFIVPMLVNSSPGIQSQAIRLLYRWDPAEALNHFELLLFSDDRSLRQAALFYGYFFPFPDIEALLLRFLSLEEDLGLLKKGGQLFIVNPSQDAAYRLADLYETCGGDKKRVLKDVVAGVVDFLAKAKMIPQKSEDFLTASGQQHYASGAPAIESNSLSAPGLSPRGGVCPEKAMDGVCVSGLSPGGGVCPEKAMDGVCVSGPSPFASLDAAGYATQRLTIFEGFSKASAEEKMAIIRLAITFEDGTVSHFFRACLKSDSRPLVTLSIEALARLNPNEFLELLDRLFQNPQAEIQIATLKALALIRRKQAQAALETFLFSAHPDRRQVGIAALAAFDAPSTNPILLKALAREKDEKLLQQLLDVVKTRPRDGLNEKVLHLCQNSQSPRKELFEAALKGFSQVPTTGKPIVLRLENEPKNNVPPTPLSEYSVGRIEALRTQAQPGPRDGGELAANVSGTPPLDLNEIESPDEVVLFHALLRLNPLSWTNIQIDKFAAVAVRQKDAGTRFHMDLILARLRAASPRELSYIPPAIQLDALLHKEGKDWREVILLLESLSRRETPTAIEALHTWNWPEFPPEVLPHLLLFLRRAGRPADGTNIPSLFRHPDPRVVLAAIEALEKINPGDVKPLLVPLLLHGNPGVRSRAIRLLYTWDIPEALKHFEANLFSDDESEKRSTLYHAYFLPFPVIEPFVFKFLSMEESPDLLMKAGYLFRVNPHPDIPMKLLQILETCSGTKREFVNDLLDKILENLYKACLIKQSPESFLMEIKERYKIHKVRHPGRQPRHRDQEAAIKAHLRRDKRQALVLIEQMLGSTAAAERYDGLLAATHCDFFAVRDLLLNALGREEDPVNLSHLTRTLIENLDPEVFASIYGIFEGKSAIAAPSLAGAVGSSDSRAFLQHLVDEAAQQLARTDGQRFPTPEAALVFARQKWQEETEKNNSPPAWAFQNIRKLRQEQKPPESASPQESLFSELLPDLSPLHILGTAIMGVFLIFSLWLLTSKEPAMRPADPPVSSVLRTSTSASEKVAHLEPGEIKDIQGSVRTVFPDGVLVEREGTSESVFIHWNQPARSYKAGGPFRGQIRVTTKKPDRWEGELIRIY